MLSRFPELSRVIESWETLPAGMRRGILAMIETDHS
jgi:hypothetical protein